MTSKWAFVKGSVTGGIATHVTHWAGVKAWGSENLEIRVPLMPEDARGVRCIKRR